MDSTCSKHPSSKIRLLVFTNGTVDELPNPRLVLESYWLEREGQEFGQVSSIFGVSRIKGARALLGKTTSPNHFHATPT